VTRVASAIVSAAIVCALAACGTTYVDTEVTVPATGPTTTTTLPPVAPDAPLDALLSEIEVLLIDLDERIVQKDQPTQTLVRIDELWVVAERQIRDSNPDDVFNFEQAIELATSGVNRLRPADASKAYKVWRTVRTEYSSR
jgi:hypothetical protein